MNRMHFLLAALVGFASVQASVEAAAPPNFIIINVDDLGYADIGPFGSNNRTPNLDRLASEGMRLTSHYAAPVCSPSRASLMTGCYPKRAMPVPHVLFPAAAVGLSPDEVTIAEVLKGAGYATACIGKWHLGDQPEFLPTRQGFDYYFGLPYSNDMGTAADGSKSNPGQVPKKAASKQKSDETGLRGDDQTPLPLLENETVIERVRGAEQFTLTKRYTDKAVTFIRDHKERPFFLYLPHSAVHFPLYPSKQFMGKSPNGLIGDWAEEVDHSTAQILDTLRELKLDGNTLVLFTSDNGGAVQFGSNNKPLRGSKASTHEGGIRVCTIARWPGKIPAGQSSDAITSMMDVLPTFAGLAGAKLPADRKIDGVDLWPLLSGAASAKPPRDHFYYFRGFQLEAVRSGDWKLRIALTDDQLRQKERPPLPQLFNLKDDIGETKNVADQHPDIVKRLQALAEATSGDLGLDGVGPGCRALGRVERPLPMIDHDGKVRADMAGAVKAFP